MYKLYWNIAYTNYFEHFSSLVSTISGCTAISVFAFSIVITSFVIGLKICAITIGIKNFKSLIKKKKMNHDKIRSLAKSKLNSIEVLISKALII